ncbi:MAG TPA: sulfatase-like hydrolase/transferase [Smithellaceae bacterium]|nr:sulfatase-like hydrolase/transferase [Smithellaceae bacterium]
MLSQTLMEHIMFPKARSESVLFITLDSCRYDTFIDADIPNLRKVGPIYRAMAPGNFTFSSHAAMFMGFTPGVAEAEASFVNPMVGKIFKMLGGGFSGPGKHRFILDGENIVDGFKKRGHYCLGTGALFWFDPARKTGRVLTRDFSDFFFPGDTYHLDKQLAWLSQALKHNDRPVFLFLNIGETHFPYYFKGAPWDRKINPCQPMAGKANDASESRRRQKACLEYVDANLAALLEAFAGGNTIVCADHGDCWGEDHLWGHGMHHEKVLEVPLMIRLTGDCDSEQAFFRKLLRKLQQNMT